MAGATAVEERVEIGSYVYPGYISTDLGNEDFLGIVVRTWGCLGQSESNKILKEARESKAFCDAVCMTSGFTVTDFMGQSINLIKLSGGGWVVVGLESFGDLEDFAKLICSSV